MAHRICTRAIAGLATLLALLWIPAGLASAQPEAPKRSLTAVELAAEDRSGVSTQGGRLTLLPDAPPSAIFAPHPRFGTAVSAAVDLSHPAEISELDLDAETPSGSRALVEIRGQVAEDWTEWSSADRLETLLGSSTVQLRVLLLAGETGASPSVRGVSFRALPLAANEVPARASAFAPPTATIWATREGLVGGTTANGHVIVERDRFVALPSTRPLNSRGRFDYVVRVEYQGRVTEAPVWDVGPWNIHDDYWNQARESFTDLPRWTPEAEAAYFNDYNGGLDAFGRFITIPTSIDLADGTFWDDLGMTNNDWVRITFLWVDAPSPPARSTPVITPKSPATPTLSASPNPVPTTGGVGTITIQWNTRAGSGQVWVSRNGQAEVLFTQGVSGSAQAPWIQGGSNYVFRLYSGTGHATLLRSTTVARASS